MCVKDQHYCKNKQAVQNQNTRISTSSSVYSTTTRNLFLQTIPLECMLIQRKLSINILYEEHIKSYDTFVETVRDRMTKA